jgi:hypothetical protein
VHVITASSGERYTLNVHISGSVDGYTLYVHAADGEGIHPACVASTLLVVERDTPSRPQS